MRSSMILGCVAISAALVLVHNSEPARADVNSAKAALELARAAREREAAKVVKADVACITDMGEARRLSAATGKPILVWIPGCDPAVREALPEAIHVHQSSWNGDKRPRLIIPRKGEPDWCIERGATVEGLRKVLRQAREVKKSSQESGGRSQESGVRQIVVAPARC